MAARVESDLVLQVQISGVWPHAASPEGKSFHVSKRYARSCLDDHTIHGVICDAVDAWFRDWLGKGWDLSVAHHVREVTKYSPFLEVTLRFVRLSQLEEGKHGEAKAKGKR